MKLDHVKTRPGYEEIGSVAPAIIEIVLEWPVLLGQYRTPFSWSLDRRLLLRLSPLEINTWSEFIMVIPYPFIDNGLFNGMNRLPDYMPIYLLLA